MARRRTVSRGMKPKGKIKHVFLPEKRMQTTDSVGIVRSAAPQQRGGFFQHLTLPCRRHPPVPHALRRPSSSPSRLPERAFPLS